MTLELLQRARQERIVLSMHTAHSTRHTERMGMVLWSRSVSLYCLLCAVCCLLAIGCATSKPLMAVTVPAADLRAQPHTTAQPDAHDAGQETQLLYGEGVRVHAIEDGWAQVEALEQPEFTHARRWQGYPGWLPSAALRPWEGLLAPTVVVTDVWATTWADPQLLTPSPWRFALGTRLRATEMGGTLWRIELLDGSMVWMKRTSAEPLATLAAMPQPDRRRLILRNASSLLDTPYYWGGRTPTPNGVAAASGKTFGAGVDCSGLVNLAYRAAGIDIPRDAHEQWLRARRVNAVQPADLIFLSERNNPARVVHVMLYAGDGAVIEGPGTGMTVRRVSVESRLGRSLDWLPAGTVIDGQTLTYGAYLP